MCLEISNRSNVLTPLRGLVSQLAVSENELAGGSSSMMPQPPPSDGSGCLTSFWLVSTHTISNTTGFTSSLPPQKVRAQSIGACSHTPPGSATVTETVQYPVLPGRSFTHNSTSWLSSSSQSYSSVITSSPNWSRG